MRMLIDNTEPNANCGQHERMMNYQVKHLMVFVTAQQQLQPQQQNNHNCSWVETK